MLNGDDVREIVRLSTQYSFAMVKELLDKKPDYISRKDAIKKYKGLLPTWEDAGLVKAVPTENAKYVVYPTHRLVELYEIWVRNLDYKRVDRSDRGKATIKKTERQQSKKQAR